MNKTSPKTILGIDRIDQFLPIFKDKRVGLITNPTGISSTFKSSIDILLEKTNLVALFGPEHGVRADVQAGEHVESYLDPITNLTVYSLYGKTRRPTPEMLEQIDVLAIDIQDIGSRYYTYIYTMAYAMMACAQYGKTFVVFDRPNPIGGASVEGNILDLEYRSFVGYYPIPQRHGMTMGELALLFNQEYQINCQLEVIPMLNWHRSMSFEETSLPWVIPSPNLPTINTCYTYNATCVFEGTNVEEGRGTTTPFELVGAPWINSYQLAQKLNSYQLEGVYFRPFSFIPMFGKYPKQMCNGVYLHVTDRTLFNPVKTSWTLIEVIWKMYPQEFTIRPPYREGGKRMFELETGCDYIINQTYPLEKQLAILVEDSNKFMITRQPYLLYR